MSARDTVLPWALTAVLLAGAWGLNAITLDDDAAFSDLVTPGTIGEPVTADNLEIVVTDVHAARSVTDARGWSAEGTWVVVDLDVAAVETQDGASIRLAELVIGGRTFTASERPTSALQAIPVVTGVPRSGSLAFELPPDALTGSATLRLGQTTFNALRPVAEMTIDLDGLAVEQQVQLDENGWAR